MKAIKIIAVFAVLTYVVNACGHGGKTEKGQVEFYLLKQEIPSLDPSTGLRGAFIATQADLQDTAFIRNSEIISLRISRDTVGSKVIERHVFNVSESAADRIQGVAGSGLDIPLCCGRQFALVVDGQIVYTGYFWNFISSFGCDAVTAFAFNGQIDVHRKLPDYGKEEGEPDSRVNQVLFDCLRSTNRMDVGEKQ